MYEYLEGKLVEKNPAYVVVDVNGVGYFVHVSLNTFSAIKDLERVRLFIHFVVREDAQLLFGFARTEEREVFRQLITVSGVGVNTARLILSSLTVNEVLDAIGHEQVALLKQVKGIGAKSAQRIIVDLKDKLGKVVPLPEISGHSYNRNRDEALSALVMLGFNKGLAGKALDRILNSNTGVVPVELMIKEALKAL